MADQSDKIQLILDGLLRYTVMDFSEKIPFGEEEDEIDAIAFGLNTLADELQGHIREISDRNEQISIIFLNAPDAMFVMNSEGGVSQWNPQAEVEFGWTRDEIVGKDFKSTIIHPDSREHYQEAVNAFKTNPDLKGLSEKLQIQLVRKNGSLFEGEMRLSPTSNNNERYFIGVITDITSQKEYETRILKSKQDAEESSLLKETFLANMSHEIRTPMNAIVGFTDLLLKKDLGAEERDYVETIKKSGEALLTIINDILDISKIEAGLIEFEENTLSISEICHSLNAMLIKKAEEKGLRLVFRQDAAVPDLVMGDGVRLTQVMINLINNAIKFTPDGSVVVAINLVKEDDHQAHLKFTFTDTGVGISSDKLEQIFERFRQAEAHTTRKFGGTGLGLSICKHLVELQGGTLSVSSEPNVGSTFTVVLPFKKAVEAKREEVHHHHITEKKLQYDLRYLAGLRILIAEDNPMNIKLIQHLFSQNGLKTDLAENGRIAVEKVKTGRYDVILMDMEMPEMNGYDATIMIRGEMKNETPIIAMTAHAMAGERERCLALGMNDYISKPINADLLFSKMYAVTTSELRK